MATKEEPFTLVERSATGDDIPRLFPTAVRCTSAGSADNDIQYIDALRRKYEGLILTVCPEFNAPLRAFAASGYANCEWDTSDSYASWRAYVPGAKRSDNGGIGEAISFAKYHYKWKGEDFILYLVENVQYILKEPKGDEHVLGPSIVADELIRTIGAWVNNLTNVVWVYDRYWRQSNALWEEVQKASWDKVILDEDMKHDLTNVAHKFFDSKAVYEDLGVPWKRGLMFYGPPGNGKTVSIKALMHSLYNRDNPVPTLYVKSAPYTWDINEVFRKARQLTPCMLVLEDVETIVTPDTRSYFFNELDGLESNDGLFIVASTNFLDKLDPGLSKRPSRFDRKYLFPIPNEHERTLYCEYWRQKLKPNKSIVFPKKLCPAMAGITSGFSFAFLQECFVATLLKIAQEEDSSSNAVHPFDSDNDDLDSYELWTTFKAQAKVLRKEVENQETRQSQLPDLYWESKEQASSATSRACSHCHCGRSPSEVDSRAITKAPFRRPDHLLPEPPSSGQKHVYFNSTAFQLKS